MASQFVIGWHCLLLTLRRLRLLASATSLRFVVTAHYISLPAAGMPECFVAAARMLIARFDVTPPSLLLLWLAPFVVRAGLCLLLLVYVGYIDISLVMLVIAMLYAYTAGQTSLVAISAYSCHCHTVYAMVSCRPCRQVIYVMGQVIFWQVLLRHGGFATGHTISGYSQLPPLQVIVIIDTSFTVANITLGHATYHCHYR